MKFLDRSSEISPMRAAARDAFIYALPLTEIANVRDTMQRAGVPAGRFYALKGLATPKDRFVTTPNVDTIYANAFIDLSQGPATLTLPPLCERYGSVSLMSMFSDNFAVLGSRTTGQDGGIFVLVGPNDPAPAGAIRSPTPWVWALARVVVNGPDDVAAALEVLHGITCQAAASTGGAPGADRNGRWDEWLRSANALMLENPAPATDRRMLERMAPLGLGDPAFDPSRFTAQEAQDIVAGFADATALSKGPALAAGSSGAGSTRPRTRATSSRTTSAGPASRCQVSRRCRRMKRPILPPCRQRAGPSMARALGGSASLPANCRLRLPSGR